LLTRLKIEKSTLDTLPPDTLEMQDAQGHWHAIRLHTLSQAPATDPAVPAAWLAPTGDYGRVMELVGTPGPALSLMSALSMRLWILPWLSHSHDSLLKRLQGMPLAQQARQMVEHAASIPELDLGLLDVALCLAQVCPGWTGGPLSWLWDEQAAQRPAWSTTEQQAWQATEQRLSRHFS
jgi:3-hydroxyacyl-CoA dehydrogenase/enoyl-CoA hydratase/3-hydroxybutyryl-CoA epimerase